MIKRRKMRFNGEWQLDGRNQVYELRVLFFWLVIAFIHMSVVSKGKIGFFRAQKGAVECWIQS